MIIWAVIPKDRLPAWYCCGYIGCCIGYVRRDDYRNWYCLVSYTILVLTSLVLWPPSIVYHYLYDNNHENWPGRCLLRRLQALARLVIAAHIPRVVRVDSVLYTVTVAVLITPVMIL